MIIEAKPKYVKIAFEAILTSIKEDRVVILPWSDQLGNILEELCDSMTPTDSTVEFHAATTPLLAHWCVRLEDK